MDKKKIAIFSSNVLLSRFFESEALLLDMKVDVLSEFSGNIENYDLVIIDSDTVFALPDAFYCPVGIVSSKTEMDDLCNSDNDECCRLTWPTSVGSIRKFLHRVNMPKKADPDILETQNNIIYYSSNNKDVVWYKNQKITLSESEMKLLFCLCKAEGKPVFRTELNSLFETENGNIVDVYIHHLRKKLEIPFSYKLIYTVRSKGYCIRAKLKKYD